MAVIGIATTMSQLSPFDGGGSPRHLAACTIAEGLGRLVAECAVRPIAVVVDAPGLDLEARSRESREALLREALVAEAAIETLDMAILGRLARLDEVELHAVHRGPGVERARDELRAVVDAERFRKS